MPRAAFTSPPELSTMVGLCHLRWSLNARNTLQLPRRCLGTILALHSAFPSFPHVRRPPFPKEPSLESSHQLSHNPSWVASSQVILHSVVFLPSERELKGMESIKHGSRHPVSATQESIPFLEYGGQGAC